MLLGGTNSLRIILVGFVVVRIVLNPLGGVCVSRWYE